MARYTRLQTVWSLPGSSRQANKGHSPRCHRRPNGTGRLADKVVQPTTQSAEGCTMQVLHHCLSEIIRTLQALVSGHVQYGTIRQSLDRPGVLPLAVILYQLCVCAVRLHLPSLPSGESLPTLRLRGEVTFTVSALRRVITNSASAR